jgi:ribosomal L7/L12-like protein
MNYTNDEKKMFVVRDLNQLIKDYGLNEVQHALRYISDYPVQPVEKLYHFNGNGVDWYLTQDEFNRIENTTPRINKIQAIKTFRDITSCGLKEAKDAIESYYDIVYRY